MKIPKKLLCSLIIASPILAAEPLNDDDLDLDALMGMDVQATSAMKRGWDKQKALKYVGETMQYMWTDRHESSLALFYKRANEMGIISSPFEIQFFDWK